MSYPEIQHKDISTAAESSEPSLDNTSSQPKSASALMKRVVAIILPFSGVVLLYNLINASVKLHSEKENKIAFVINLLAVLVIASILCFYLVNRIGKSLGLSNFPERPSSLNIKAPLKGPYFSKPSDQEVHELLIERPKPKQLVPKFICNGNDDVAAPSAKTGHFVINSEIQELVQILEEFERQNISEPTAGETHPSEEDSFQKEEANLFKSLVESRNESPFELTAGEPHPSDEDSFQKEEANLFKSLVESRNESPFELTAGEPHPSDEDSFQKEEANLFKSLVESRNESPFELTAGEPHPSDEDSFQKEEDDHKEITGTAHTSGNCYVPVAIAGTQHFSALNQDRSPLLRK